MGPLEHRDEEKLKIVSVYEIGGEEWYQLLIDYLEKEKLPSESRHKTKVQWRVSCFRYYKETLHRHSFLGF